MMPKRQITSADSIVRPDDVKEFLAARKPVQAAPEETPPVEQTIEVELTDEEKAAVTAALDKEVETGRVKVEIPPVYGAEHAPGPLSGVWTMHTDDLKKIEVTEHEKEAYWRSLLHDDAPVELEVFVPVRSGLTVCVRSIDNYEQELVFAAVKQDDIEGQIPSMEFSISRMQRYFAAIQILKIQNIPVAYYTSPKTDDARSFSSLKSEVHKLREARTKLDRWQQPKWLVAWLALRIFETKLSILHEGALNRDFWKTAGTD
jgi:hypothetical protein